MSDAAFADTLPAPRFLGAAEASQLLYLLRQDRISGTVVQMIAAREGEGTSSLARDLALSAAQAGGLRVLLLDIDAGGRGQTDWLRARGAAPLTLVGSLAGQPADLVVFRLADSALHLGELQTRQPMSAGGWAAMLPALRARFDLVVIDSPPLARSFDGVMLSPHVDGVLLVIEAEATRATQAQSLRDRLSEVGGHVVGAVLNKRRFHVPQSLYERF